MIAIRPEDTAAHASLADEMDDRYAGQAQAPRTQQGESRVQAHAVYRRGCVEEDNRRLVEGLWRMAGDLARHVRYPAGIQAHLTLEGQPISQLGAGTLCQAYSCCRR